MEPAAPASPCPASVPERPKLFPVEGPAYQISQEHCYAKLGPFRSDPSAGFFPTEVLFPSLVKVSTTCDKDGRGDCTREGEEETGDNQQQSVGVGSGEGEDEEEEEEEGDIDVVGGEPPISLPYDESKAGLIMMECVKHLNLVKIPPENSDLLLEKVLLECGFQQRRLLSTLLRILQGDHLARLTCQQVGWLVLLLLHTVFSLTRCRLLTSRSNGVYTMTEPCASLGRHSVMSTG